MSKPLEIEVHGLKNFTDAEKAKFKEAMKILKRVVNSREFYTRFMNLDLEQNNGLNNVEIYNMLMSGSDKFSKTSDYDIDVNLTMYYSWKKTIGYTYPSTWATWINRRFFSKFDVAEICMNVLHEYFHNLGFGHIRSSDHKSVPYASGYLVRDMIRNGFEDIPIKAGDVPDSSVVVNEKNPTRPVVKTYHKPWYKRLWNWVRGK